MSAPPAAAAEYPPYETARILAAPFPERMRLVCRTWAAQIHPNPPIILALYWAKYLFLFVGGWALFTALPAGEGGFLARAFSPLGFQKALLWALFYESAGFGCSSGPMNARYKPPLGGFLHFLRPGATKLPLFPRLPLLGGWRRTWFDVALYAAHMLLLLRALLAPQLSAELLWPCALIIPLLGVADKTLFLAARSEHYWVALTALAAAHSAAAAAGGAAAAALWIPACKIIWCAIWFWAATSKLNSHFPYVIMVMMNNGPCFPKWLKRRLFAAYPADLRPSRMAAAMAHGGTATEYALGPLLLYAGLGLGAAGFGAAGATPGLLVFALCLMAGFHGFIALNNPSGMPIEWNILMVYGGVFLFGFHPQANPAEVLALPLLAAFLFLWMAAIPCFGNFVPARVSFLLAMRYYAGNWAYNIWLFRGESWRKLARLTKASGTLREQLQTLLPDAPAVELALQLSKAHRFMHLEGRPLLDALPRAVAPGKSMDDYEWMDGEILAGMVLGWNFGDGHLNGEHLLAALQAQCNFAPGEVRVVSVESQPLFAPAMQWRVADAAAGVLASGATEIAPMRAQPPWPAGPYAAAYEARRTAAAAADAG